MTSLNGESEVERRNASGRFIKSAIHFPCQTIFAAVDRGACGIWHRQCRRYIVNGDDCLAHMNRTHLNSVKPGCFEDLRRGPIRHSIAKSQDECVLFLGKAKVTRKGRGYA